jgi:undecaprenyl-diphosphatase
LVVQTSGAFVPHPDGPATHVAERVGNPAAAGGSVLVGSYLAITAAMLLLGLLLTKVLVDHGVGSFDSAITDWLVARRTTRLNDLTKYATYLANTEPVVAIAAVVTIVLLVFRRWREAIFLASSLVIELTVFLSVNYVVARPRPDVERLNATPGTSSFPSGHAAASLVLWVGIALIVVAVTTNVVVRVIAWIPVATLVWMVPFARVYRGMHHTTDVIAGLAVGGAAVVAGCFVARTWAAAMKRRHADGHEREQVPMPEMASAGR